MPRDTGYRSEVGDALFELPSSGKDIGPALAAIGDSVSRLAAEGKFHENRTVFVDAITRELAYRYVIDARDQFYSGHPDRAIEETQKAQLAARSYPYAPIMLHVFRLRSGEDDSTEFAKNTERVDQSEWPWPIILFLRGEADATALMSAATSTGTADDRPGQVCEADFFVGLEDVAQNKPAEARPLLQLAQSNCPRDYIVYDAAVAELKWLDAVPPPQATHSPQVQ